MGNVSRESVRFALGYLRASTGVACFEERGTFVVSGTFEQVKEVYVNVSQSANDYNICSLLLQLPIYS